MSWDLMHRKVQRDSSGSGPISNVTTRGEAMTELMCWIGMFIDSTPEGHPVHIVPLHGKMYMVRREGAEATHYVWVKKHC